MHEIYMRQALALAHEAAGAGEVPVGCVIVQGGAVVGRGRNRREEKHSALSHAETEAIAQANAALGALWHPLTRAFHVKDGTARVKLDFDAPGMTLYGGAALSIKIGTVVWVGLRAGWQALFGALAAKKRLKLKRQQRKAA